MRHKEVLTKIDAFEGPKLADFIYSHGITRQDLEALINESDKNDKKVNWNLKLDEAFERINSPLNVKSKLIYFFIPFGKFTTFSKGPSFIENGYFRKEKQFLIYSWLGLFFYVIIILIVGFFT